MKVAENLTAGGVHLLDCLCPDQDHLPYWHMVVDEDQRAEYQFRRHCNGHNVGRWWNAVLRLQATTGFDIPAPVEADMLAHTWRMCDNPTGILLDDPDPDRIDTWYIHSYRETMLALGLLVAHRNCATARRQGLRAIAQMGKASADLTQWDLSRCGPMRCDPLLKGRGSEPCYTHGRAIEGLLCFYEATGQQQALDEAGRLAEFHFARTVDPAGGLASGCGHHTHSYLNTVRGLVQYAALVGRPSWLETLLATYRNAVSAMITPSGFATHDTGDTSTRSGGDIAAAGDIAHIALLLWDHFRDPTLLDDAERLARCRLVPAQIRELMPVRPRSDDGQDCHRDLPRRFVGAIGGSVGQAQGQTCVTDFTAAALHSLIELYGRTVEATQDVARVNFHFDAERAGVAVRCLREGATRRVEVRSAAPRDLLIRVPAWAPTASVQLTVNGDGEDVQMREGFAFVPSAGRQETGAVLCYALPEVTRREAWREPAATQDHLVFHWRGDEIAGVDPIGPYLAPWPKPCGSFL